MAMELFNNTKAVKLRSHLDKYLVADDDQETTRQSRNGESKRARWLVEVADHDGTIIRLKSCHGKYLTASNDPFLLGMTGQKVLQTLPENYTKDMRIEWEPIRDGFQVKLRTYGGTYLRANGGTPPWRNSITHDKPLTGSTYNWILWEVEAVDIPENESLNDYLSIVSSFSSVSAELSGLELGSPVSIHSTSFNSPRLSTTPRKSPLVKITAMELFHNAKAVRLRSIHNKYLTAEEDEDSVTQGRNGSSKAAKWTVEFVSNAENIIRLKSCYSRYLTASNQSFLLGMTGRKVLQTNPKRLDSSVEWEPIREGNQVKLKTRYGQFLRANGGVPPWRNSVTHDIPHRTVTQEWILWDVHVVEIVLQSPVPKPPPPLVPHSDSFASESSSPSAHSSKSASFSRQQSGDSLESSPRKAGDGRLIYYTVADEYGEVDEGVEGLCITFKGNGVDELTKRLEEETGLEGIVVCTKSPLNGKLYPLRLQLPPNNATMNVVVVQSYSEVAGALSF
ncbi:hypothetical protein ACH5RR_035763 [Cinchona calisaya]|uniref:Actin cross-linking n=1 Tax=Cinchona calisaya TaxID=153742 RepID=A0ABD2Y159_9GENT